MEKQQSSWQSYIVPLAFVVLLGLFVGLTPARELNTATDTATGPEEQVTTTVMQSLSYQGQDGETAFELLDATHEVESQPSDAVVFVTKIDGVGGDPDTFWLYYVNGESAMVAADQYETKDGDTVEWRYEKF